MQLTSLLDHKLIYFEDEQLTKAQIFEKLVQKICKHYKLPQCGKELYDMVLQREAESSTVYPTGLAIPHVRIDNFNDTVVAICIPRQPLVENEQVIKVICLIITDKTASKLYLNLVASVLRISKDEKLMASILSQKDGAGVHHVLLGAGITVKEDLSIKDVMSTEPITILDTATIRELAEIMSQKNIKSLPVVDSKGNFAGEVNILQYLKVGVPDYLMLMDNLLFLRTYEPFESIFDKEDVILVKDIMTKPDEVLAPDNSIIEAVFKMIQHNKRFFTVVHDKKVVGMITAMDVFRKVVRA